MRKQQQTLDFYRQKGYFSDVFMLIKVYFLEQTNSRDSDARKNDEKP